MQSIGTRLRIKYVNYNNTNYKSNIMVWLILSLVDENQDISDKDKTCLSGQEMFTQYLRYACYGIPQWSIKWKTKSKCPQLSRSLMREEILPDIRVIIYLSTMREQRRLYRCDKLNKIFHHVLLICESCDYVIFYGK